MEIIGIKQESKWKRRIYYFHQTNYSEVLKHLFPINAFSIKSSSCWVKTRINIRKADWFSLARVFRFLNGEGPVLEGIG